VGSCFSQDREAEAVAREKLHEASEAPHQQGLTTPDILRSAVVLPRTRELGGFNTEWNGSSLELLAAHQAAWAQRHLHLGARVREPEPETAAVPSAPSDFMGGNRSGGEVQGCEGEGREGIDLNVPSAGTHFDEPGIDLSHHTAACDTTAARDTTAACDTTAAE